MHNNPCATADVALLLEGTYPYVRGGVSGWVHELIRGLPEYSFALVFLGATREGLGAVRYTLPDNVVSLNSYYLMESLDLTPSGAKQGNTACFAHADLLHNYFRDPDYKLDEGVLSEVLKCLGRPGQLGPKDFLFSEASWHFICDRYKRFANKTEFVEYFWTVRTIHAALFKLANIVRRVPLARAFHSMSTGYAGFLGMLLRNSTGRPFILTEHGIYTKERKIDLQAAYIQDSQNILANPSDTGMSYYHHLWIRFFEGIGRLIYAHADPIIALYEINRQRQIRDGADASRTRVVPNGVELERFVSLRMQRPKSIPPILGLIGRIVSIKDIKTFIRAMRGVCARLPQAQGWLIGPDDEDPEYAQECRDLVHSLGLGERIKFLGFQKVETILPKLGLLVLTSISEAFPLVIVEAFASGLPVLTTDVGGCRGIIEGSEPEDQALGPAGKVVPIANPEATAEAALELLTNASRWRAAQRAGIQRVERYYTQQNVIACYRGIYRRAMEN
jgi:glycosyltransferase involved in cell wall biosynthesis